MERCQGCGLKIELRKGMSIWSHMRKRSGELDEPCGYPRPGMGLIQMIHEYWGNPKLHAIWSKGLSSYTEFAILHALRQQATIHWNNCSNTCNHHCEAAAEQHADSYMLELKRGRHDLHPYDDDEVHSAAFEIHNKLVAIGEHLPSRARAGAMTCTYITGPGSSERCNCYEQAYRHWKLDHIQREGLKPVKIDDLYWSERFD